MAVQAHGWSHDEFLERLRASPKSIAYQRARLLGVHDTSPKCLASVFLKDWEYRIMTCTKLALGAAFALTMFGGYASGQGLRQPQSVQPVALTYDYYFQPDVESSPSDIPIPPAAERPGATEPSAVPGHVGCGADIGCGGNSHCGCDANGGGNGCGDCGNGCEDECESSEREIWHLFPQDTCSGWKIYGWMAQGVTTNRYNPVNPAAGQGNLPITFNYRNDEYQLNQLYGVLEREADNEGCGLAWGGRIDLLYGEDYIFTQAAGLETHQDFTPHWNSATGNGINGLGRLGLAMPQLYGEVAYNDVSVKFGHFYTIMGYESVMAPSNFFYSHAYTHQWGEPFTHTGAIATWKYNDRWTFIGGVVNGWDNFDALTDRAAGIGGFVWTSEDERASVAFSAISGDEVGSALPIIGRRDFYALVISYELTENWQYVFQHDYGRQENGRGPGQSAHWYGINQYLYYTINDCWKAGIRGEWFNDQNGTRVLSAIAVGAPFQGGTAGFAGHYNEVAVGLNWSPSANFILRPELRWDGFDPHPAAALPAAGPFSSSAGPFTRNDAFTAAVDLIIHY
jgi:hypothetical protein